MIQFGLRLHDAEKLPLEQVAGVVPEHTEYRAYGADGGFLGIAQAEPETGLLRVGKNFS